MICCAVIDTNVLVSALISNHSDAATVQLMERLIMGDIIPVYSAEIMKEYRNVLGRKKFKFDSDLVKNILYFIKEHGILVKPTATGIILPDIKDLPFFEVVMDRRDEGAYLVTGNLKHFPQEPFIVSPRQLLDIVDGIQEHRTTEERGTL